MDVDPEREWFYSITIVDTDTVVSATMLQGGSATRSELVDRVRRLFGARTLIVHHLERNDL